MNHSTGNAAVITRLRSKVNGVAHAAMHRISPGSTAIGNQPHQDHPAFHRFLEPSCLAREMRRL